MAHPLRLLASSRQKAALFLHAGRLTCRADRAKLLGKRSGPLCDWPPFAEPTGAFYTLGIMLEKLTLFG